MLHPWTVPRNTTEMEEFFQTLTSALNPENLVFEEKRICYLSEKLHYSDPSFDTIKAHYICGYFADLLDTQQFTRLISNLATKTMGMKWLGDVNTWIVNFIISVNGIGIKVASPYYKLEFPGKNINDTFKEMMRLTPSIIVPEHVQTARYDTSYNQLNIGYSLYTMPTDVLLFTHLVKSTNPEAQLKFI